jgi:hypothetical protein
VIHRPGAGVEGPPPGGSFFLGDEQWTNRRDSGFEYLRLVSFDDPTEKSRNLINAEKTYWFLLIITLMYAGGDFWYKWIC